MANQNMTRARARSMVKIVYVVMKPGQGTDNPWVVACYTTEARADERAEAVGGTVIPVHLEV